MPRAPRAAGRAGPEAREGRRDEAEVPARRGEGRQGREGGKGRVLRHELAGSLASQTIPSTLVGRLTAGEWRNGRRAGFRSRCRKTCEFESRLAHHRARPRIARSRRADYVPSSGRTATFIQRSPVARRIAKVRSNGDDSRSMRPPSASRRLGDHRPASGEPQAQTRLCAERHEERDVDRVELVMGEDHRPRRRGRPQAILHLDEPVPVVDGDAGSPRRAAAAPGFRARGCGPGSRRPRSCRDPPAHGRSRRRPARP